MAAEDNFNELASLRPVLDSHGDPVMMIKAYSFSIKTDARILLLNKRHKLGQ